MKYLSRGKVWVSGDCGALQESRDVIISKHGGGELQTGDGVAGVEDGVRDLQGRIGRVFIRLSSRIHTRTPSSPGQTPSLPAVTSGLIPAIQTS